MTVLLLVAALLVSYVPAWAAVIDSTELYSFNLFATTPSSNRDNGQVVYNVSYDEEDAGDYYGRINSPRSSWVDINYNTIGTAADFTAFSQQFTNETRVPGNKMDISDAAEAGKAVFSVSIDEDVDRNNLYLALVTKNDDGESYAGVLLADYLSDDESEGMIAVSLSEFEEEENFIGSTGEEAAIDLSAFCGLGIVRTNDESGTNPESAGIIRFTQLDLVNLAAIDDLAAEADEDAREIVLSFTAPTLTTIDEYTINIVAYNGEERTETLTADDFEVDGGKYIWRDTDVVDDMIYTYTITLHEEDYDMESTSNAVEAVLPEDIGGTDIPAGNTSSTVENFDVRDYSWRDGLRHYESSINLKAGANTNTISASTVGLGSGKLTRIEFNYDNKEWDADNIDPIRFQRIVDYMNFEFVTTDEVTGGATGKDIESFNVAAIADTGVAMYQIYIDETVDLNNLYFAIASGWTLGNKNYHNRIGVPVLDYISEEDLGKPITVSIPLKDFNLSYPGMFQHMYCYTYDTYTTYTGEIDFTHMSRMGFVRDCLGEDAEHPESSGYIYIAEMRVCNVEPATNLKATDSKPEKVILGWDHSTTDIEKYNVYRVEDGEKVLVGSTTKNTFADLNGGEGFEIGETYTYVVDAVDEWGTAASTDKLNVRIQEVDRPRNFTVENYYSDTNELAVEINWSAAVYGEPTEYVLYRNGKEYQRFGTDEFSFWDTDLDEHATYTYYMKSVNDDYESIETNKVTVSATCLPTPTNLAYTIEGDDVTLTWDDVDYVDVYEILVNGEVVGETDDTTYTVSNMDYNTELTFGVRAVNAAGATSNTVETSKLFLRDPSMEIVKSIITDTTESGYSVGADSGVTTRYTTDKFIEGEKSLLISFPTQKVDDQIAKVTGTLDIVNQRENGGLLTFWIYVDESTDLSNMEIALSTTTTMSWTNVPLRSILPLGDYVTEQGKWCYVEIPFADFPTSGIASYQKEQKEMEINFTAVKELTFVVNTANTVNGIAFYIDDLAIQQGQAWNVVSVADNTDAAIADGDTVSAAVEALKVTFDTAMQAATLNTATVWVEDVDGNVINAYGEYANKVYTLNFLEPLAQDTAYTLYIDGAKTTDGKSGVYETDFTTNSDEPADITYEIPAIAPVITSTKSGSTATVTLAMPEDAAYAVADYEIVVEYDDDDILLNGGNAITLTALKGAEVKKEDGKITFKGSYDGKELTGNLATIKFVAQKTTDTTIKVNGTVDVYNAMADKSAEAAVAAEKSISVKKESSSGGSGSGGGGYVVSGDKATREQATINGDAPIIQVMGNDGTTSTATFTDLYEVEWAADSIKYLTQNGYISGYPDNTFRPNNKITREEFAALVVRVFRFSSEATECAFTDVADDAWYRSAIIVAQDKGVVSGVDETTFGVGKTITREEMCAMVYRAMTAARMTTEAKYDAYIFADQANISEYAADAITALYKAGIISGVSDTEFAPKADVTRAMAARVLYGVEGLI